jgi:hypothetical protein
MSEIVAVIGIAHDDEAPPCCYDTSHERSPIAAFRNRDDAGPALFRQGSRTIRGTVIGNQNLAGDAAASEK